MVGVDFPLNDWLIAYNEVCAGEVKTTVGRNTTRDVFSRNDQGGHKGSTIGGLSGTGGLRIRF